MAVTHTETSCTKGREGEQEGSNTPRVRLKSHSSTGPHKAAWVCQSNSTLETALIPSHRESIVVSQVSSQWSIAGQTPVKETELALL
jgi:hypothetical protein